MRRFLPVVALLPCGLFAQAITELSPLEYRPILQERSRQASPDRKPLSFEQGIPAPSAYRLGSLRQLEIDAVERDPHLPLRGVERVVDRRSGQRGEWVTLDDGRTAWRLTIQSDGASGVRLEFSRFAVGSGEVWLYSEDHSQMFGPYTGAGPDASGEFWSNTIFADSVVVEYLPEQPRNDTPFLVSKVLHILPAEQAMAAGTCELDVSCYSDWSAVASGVGLYFFQKGGGSYACTGALVNNTNKDGKPYFLTANHCVADAATAKTVNVFWNYQTPSCNGKAPNLSGLPQTIGATWLASAPIANGDYSLIQLSPLPNINLTFYGWNGSATALQVGDPTVGVHHPSADFKRIAFGVRDPDMNAQVGSEYAPASLFYQVRETAGRIEPGSSGSPLFTAAKVVVGTLTYGPPGDACSISPFSAGYGRFSAALPALSTYLSPAPASGGGGSTPPAATVSMAPSSLRTSWTLGSAAPVAQNVQLTTASSSTVSLTIKANQSWILPSATALTVAQTKPVTLSISVNAQALTAAGTYLGSVSVTGTGINQSIPFEVDVAVAGAAVKGGPVTVIPLFLDGSGASTSFSLVNPYATATVASLSFESSTGAAVAVPVASATASWQNVTIPAFGTTTISTAGNSSPQKSGMAVIQSGDPAKRVQAWAQINGDTVAPAAQVTPPFVVPFDATAAAGTTLYLFNTAATGTLALNLNVYDTSGTLVGTGLMTIPAQQEGILPMTRTAAVFGGRKGILDVTATGPVSAMGIRTAADGRISSVPVAGQ